MGIGQFPNRRSEILQNKDIDGGTASNDNRLTLPKASTSELSALVRKKGTLAYDETLDQVVVDNGSAFAAVGGGSGVSTLNTLSGDLTLAAGTNITITPSGGDTLTIDASGGITWASPVDSHIIPDTNNIYAIGQVNNGFASLYVNAVYDLDGGQVLNFNTGTELNSNDGDIGINSNATGKLVLGAEDIQVFSVLGGAPHIRFYKAGGANYTQFGISNAISTNTSFVLPGSDGSSNQVLKTDGSGNLSFGALVTEAGPTANRPVTPVLGQQYFDTDLAAGAGKPIWYNGADWVDATGAIV